MSAVLHEERACVISQGAASLKPRKWVRVLTALVAGRSFNRFESERELKDHCLPSTIATLQAKGLLIHRRDETVPGFQQIPTRVSRYWLAPESMEKAAELLGNSASTGAIGISA